ncbi:MAG: hypothetical protein AAFR02_01630 [Pseudomonadota bacterium]
MNGSEHPPSKEGPNSATFGEGSEKHSNLLKASQSSGRSLNFWSDFTEGLDDEAVAKLAARAHLIPEDIPGSWASLQKDQKEVASLFSQIDDSDRKTMLHALRALVELRAEN